MCLYPLRFNEPRLNTHSFTLILYSFSIPPMLFFFFFFNDPAPPEISPLPLPAALPIFGSAGHDAEQRAFAVTADQERRGWWLLGARIGRGAAQRVVASVEIDRSTGPQGLDDGDPLLETVEAFLERRKPDPKRLVLGDIPSGADPEDQPAAGEEVDGGGHPGEQGRVSKRHRAHQRAEPDPASALRQRRQRRPAFERRPLPVSTEAEEMIRAPQRIEAELFDPISDSKPVLPG